MRDVSKSSVTFQFHLSVCLFTARAQNILDPANILFLTENFLDLHARHHKIEIEYVELS